MHHLRILHFIKFATFHDKVLHLNGKNLKKKILEIYDVSKVTHGSISEAGEFGPSIKLIISQNYFLIRIFCFVAGTYPPEENSK